MDRNSLSLRPQPLSYKELSKGALYNAAEPTRQETRHPGAHHSLEHLHLHLHDDTRGSIADLTAGHLYNPTSSMHEVDPPTWPAYGMENVGSSASPFKSYRHERPPSPVLAKRFSMTYQSRRPSHNTVASGALFNPYVSKRLPAELDTASARLLADSSAMLSRPTSRVDHVFRPAPVMAVPLNQLEASASASGGAPKGNGDAASSIYHQTQYYPPPGSHHPSAHLAPGGGGGGGSRRLSVGSYTSTRSNNPPDPLQGTAMYMMHPGQSHSADDDSMYYHPSREQSVHRIVPPPGDAGTGDPNEHLGDWGAHPAPRSHGSMASIGQGSVSTMRPTPWMQQEDVNFVAGEGVHPSRTHSGTDDSMYYHPSREATVRGPSSLHNEYHEGNGDAGSAHPSRAPSHRSRDDAASDHFSYTDMPANASLHPSRAPTVIRDSMVHEGGADIGWGAPDDQAHIPSRAPTVHSLSDKKGSGSLRAVDSVKNFKTSRTPSATTHVSRFQDQNMIEVLHPGMTGHAPSAASRAPSRASLIQRHMGGSRAGTPAIHEEGGAGAQHFELEDHTDHDAGVAGAPLPIPNRAPSVSTLVNDAASHHSRAPSTARAGGASPAPSQHTLTHRGRASRLGRGSGRATPMAVAVQEPEAEPEPPNSASTYRISVVRASDDGREA